MGTEGHGMPPREGGVPRGSRKVLPLIVAVKPTLEPFRTDPAVEVLAQTRRVEDMTATHVPI